MSRLILPLVLAAVAARAWLHWSTPMVQGMNGAYYLVQARSLIEKLSLAIPDLPLVFVIQACIGKLIHWCSWMSLNASVMLAVKLVDSVLPALAVMPVVLLGQRWSNGDKVDTGIIAMAALLVPAGAPALLMLGDFEKNSLGLMLLCALVWALHGWVAEPTRGRLVVAVALLGLISLTHIGVLGTTLIFIGGALAGFLMAKGRASWRTIVKLGLLAAPVVLIAAGIVHWKFDPARVQKLISAFTEPTSYLAAQGGPRGPMGPGFGGPPSWFQYAPMLGFALASVPALVLVWARRRTIGLANLIVISGAALTVILLTGPWVQGDKLMRFQLNAVPLAILCLLFTLLHIPHRWARGVPGMLVLIAALIPSALKLKEGAHPIITEEAYAELQSLAASVEQPGQTMVVARHGLEWWTAWALHTHIAQAQALESSDWKRYKYVWFIEQKKGMGMMPGGPGMRPPPTGLRRGPGGPMMGEPMPPYVEILHDGECFRLGWARRPTESVIRREQSPFDVFSPLGVLDQ